MKRQELSQWTKSVRLPALIFVFFLYLLHALFFSSWIVDDAGITFSYARNLAHGHGLVSQPGVEPVEGYSNFLWLMSLAPFFLFDIFHPLIVPKVLSFLLVFVLFVFMDKSIQMLDDNRGWMAYIIPSMLSINTSFVVWTSSGLENSLYALLIMILFYLTLKCLVGEQAPRKRLIELGLVAGAIALTRPDGVMYFLVYPLLLLLFRFAKFQKSTRKYLIGLFVYTLPFIFTYGSYLAFRLLYFHDFYPNTYYAKSGPAITDLKDIFQMQIWTYSRLYSLMESVGGSYGALSLLISFLFAVHLFYAGRLKVPLAAAGFFLYLSIFSYLLLPADWMPEYRFATPMFPFYYLFSINVFAAFMTEVKADRRLKRPLVVAAFLFFFGGSVFMFKERSVIFAKSPTVPFSTISESFGHEFNKYAERLELEKGSILLPDVGGTLYYSKLKVYDLGGLCDKTIARTINKNQAEFFDYVFEKIKPTFILTHHSWTHKAAFDLDPRFRRDYIPVNEYIDEEIKKKHNLSMYSGFYVRKGAVENKIGTFRQIQEEYKAKYVYQ